MNELKNETTPKEPGAMLLEHLKESREIAQNARQILGASNEAVIALAKSNLELARAIGENKERVELPVVEQRTGLKGARDAAFSFFNTERGEVTLAFFNDLSRWVSGKAYPEFRASQLHPAGIFPRNTDHITALVTVTTELRHLRRQGLLANNGGRTNYCIWHITELGWSIAEESGIQRPIKGQSN